MSLKNIFWVAIAAIFLIGFMLMIPAFAQTTYTASYKSIGTLKDSTHVSVTLTADGKDYTGDVFVLTADWNKDKDKAVAPFIKSFFERIQKANDVANKEATVSNDTPKSIDKATVDAKAQE